MTEILILGAGIAGIRAAKVLAKQNLDATITVVNQNDYHYETTSLAGVAAGTAKVEQIMLPLPASLPQSVKFIKATVTKINREAHTVELEDHADLHFDYLIVALGIKSEDYGIKGAKEFGMPIVSVDTAVALKEHIEKTMANYNTSKDPNDLHVVVCGAWWSAFEFLGELAEHLPVLAKKYNLPLNQMKIDCIEAKDKILPMYSDKLTGYIKATLKKKGANLHLGMAIDEVKADRVISGDKVFMANTIVLTTGLSGSQVISDSGFENRRNRMVVQNDVSIKEDKNIFMVGDVATVMQPGKSWPFANTGQLAMEMGTAAAKNIAADLTGNQRQDFSFKDLGSVLGLGKRDGAAAVFGNIELRGYPASVMKVIIYDRSLLEEGTVSTVMKHGRFNFLRI
ncbi:NAD(P)/FAD-dependent oxidoreductase [Loigolactobacillus iwatensis]|uniref:NAD(P)/FAD-dependent oxidoreductase n=1 Tax=Loigolactobacillus iwatensis TaxID=1267156 RepID=UPI000F7EAEE1|nr:NAD(P)/FAD-dependent oxidoreductase [Loigolactobacillus iwatensis]